jgi:hypothetical protein
MIFYIDGILMPNPTDYSLKHANIETVSEAVSGFTLVRRVRSDKRSLSVSWSHLSAAEYAAIRTACTPVSVVVNFRGEGNSWIQFSAKPSDFSAVLKAFDDRFLIQSRWAISSVSFEEF